MFVTNQGVPVEIHFEKGSENELNVLWKMEHEIPNNSLVYADGAHKGFSYKDVLFRSGALQTVLVNVWGGNQGQMVVSWIISTSIEGFHPVHLHLNSIMNQFDLDSEVEKHRE